MAEKKKASLTLPLMITRGLVLFPGNQKLIEAGRSISTAAVLNAVNNTDSLILLTSQKDSNIEKPEIDDFYHIGSLCRIIGTNERNSNIKVRLEVVERVQLEDIVFDNATGCYIAKGVSLPSLNNDGKDYAMLIDQMINGAGNMLLANMPKSLINQLNNSNDPVLTLYALALYIEASNAEKQHLLELQSVDELFHGVEKLINNLQIKNKIENDLANDVRESSEKSQREYFLREKLRAIRKELGDDDNDASNPDNILEELEKHPYPENIKAKIKNEIKKLNMLPPGQLEGGLIRSYIDVLMSIPWYQSTEDDDDLKKVEEILDEDHYGLEDAKKRIIEYLAVKKLTGNLKSPILCFYGPPGTGKTSLGKSIARALNRKFFKAALGGISDEAEIRGHRRTYVGSMPGRIIQGMRKVGVKNPVFLLDEVDKLASSYKGDPASALLEVLDPEQNTAFNDNYVEEPYDLSDVLFICTANYLENVPAPLRDRLELIELSSYTDIEKKQIAKKHLFKKQRELNGLKANQVSIEDAAIEYIIRHYTRESGVRGLERAIASCLRKVAVEIVKDPSIKKITIDVNKVKEYLGVEIFLDHEKDKEKQIGVVTGLAYTQFGGDILPIETNYFKGKGALVLTGNLGDVMKESVTIALDYVKANAEKYHIDPEIFANNDIHVHFPEGAVPKDGPSAGVAITCALISCLSNTRVNPDVAMTGEVNLRGKALPIGGLKEKTLAALRSGITTVIVPEGNKRDVDKLPKEVKTKLKIIFMNNVEDATKVCLIND